MKRLHKLTVPQLQSIIRDNQPRKPKIEFGSPILIGFRIFCFFSFLYAVFNFRYVLIDYKSPLLLGGLFGLIGVFFTKNRNNYFFAFIGYGSFIIGLPLFINNAFKTDYSAEVKLPILNKHHSVRRHGPSVDINYKGIEKEINIDDDEMMDKSSYIVLKINKGRLGYYFITDKRLTKY